ncbi:hypothetical protein GLAREA_04171 [Glarea lozoyensis ATCC 20868]|uniref:SigF-like NTF2-like domain-containing protein n=1 Tax=Glarea lozoyensis (strain ATCC 20868 / MF5171) TaxID=1116229 RepID=S3D221_GLAL2|nr:uncharacterized protein GLAREA_04171 [Glarea lozoyensis ATCC 20868]EPE31204.1 hypothetical protein GLAREA_04171 [Glarea lozoyensis ATCC 20868]
MDDPKTQIPSIIKSLTEGSPSAQHHALQTYFHSSASFTHPLCRVPSFSHISLPFVGEINSRWVVGMIYRWYKILSPRIVLDVEVVEFNKDTDIIFLNIHQIFSLFFVPFYKSNVHLTTVLNLVQLPDPAQRAEGKYYIIHQEDLYQTDEVVKFFWPGGSTVIWGFQMFATCMCILGALALAPVTWAAERRARGKVNGVGEGKGKVNGIGKRAINGVGVGKGM